MQVVYNLYTKLHMEFLTKKQKQRRTKQLFFGYALLSVLTILLSFILVSTARGYVFFSRDGELRQNGLLFLSSKPGGADVYINGVKEQNTTDSKLSLGDGIYLIELKKQGFNTWSKSVELRGGEVSFVTYPRLTPVSPKTATLDSFVSYVPMLSASRDKRWAIAHQESNFLSWKIYDMNNITDPPQPLSVSEAVFGVNTTPVSDAEVLEWASDNVHILIKFVHQDAKRSFLVCSRSDTTCQSLTTIFGVNTNSRFAFWDGRWDQYYYIDILGVLRRGDLKTAAIAPEAIVVDKIGQFYPLADARFIYSTSQGNNDSVVKLFDGTTVFSIGTFPVQAEKLIFASAGFNSNEYVAVGGSDLNKTYVYKNPAKPKKIADQKIAPSILLPISSTIVEFSHGNRFLLAAQGANAYVYDLTSRDQVKSSLLLDGRSPQLLGWIDASRYFTLYQDGSLYVQDFDGLNHRKFLSAVKTAPLTTEDGATMLVMTAPKGIVNALGISVLLPTE